MYFKYIDNDCQGKPYARNYYDTTIISIQKKKYWLVQKRRLRRLLSKYGIW